MKLSVYLNAFFIGTKPIKIISTLYDNIKNIIDTSKYEVAVSINKYDDTCLLGDRSAFER